MGIIIHAFKKCNILSLNARFRLVELLANGYHNSHMTKSQEKLGKKVKKLRKQKGLTQEGLAEKLNISRTHMGHIEQGRKSPSLKLLSKLAKALRVKVKDIFPF